MPLRIFLVLMVVVFLPYGLLCFFAPETVAEATGMALHSTTASTEVRAMYGGLQAAVGVYALVALFRPALVRPVLVTLVFLFAGLALGRLGGVLLDGAVSPYTGGALGFEIVGAFVASFFATRATPQPAA